MIRKCKDCKCSIVDRHPNATYCIPCALKRDNVLSKIRGVNRVKKRQQARAPYVECKISKCRNIIFRAAGKRTRTLCDECTVSRARLQVKYGVRKHSFKKRGVIDFPAREEYDSLVKEAKKRKLCIVCGRKNKGRWVLHHCHKTGLSVKTLICNRCNVGFGFFDDDPEIILRAYKWFKNQHKILGTR